VARVTLQNFLAEINMHDEGSTGVGLSSPVRQTFYVSDISSQENVYIFMLL
jgi:hypothetical protein